MTPELTALTLAAIWQCAQFVLMAVPTNLEVGSGKTLSPRDTKQLGKPLADQVSARTGRLIRAFNNHVENLILFAIAAIVITITDQSTPLTQAAAWTYLAARILYVPAYAFGLVPWRSLIWFAGWLSTLTMLVAALI